MTQFDISLREDIYQTYHPYVLKALNRMTASGSGARSITLDAERAAFMFAHKSATGQRVLDIGANQGYMSVEAALRGARSVDAFESNDIDGTFLSQAARTFPELGALNAHALNYEFAQNNTQWSYVVCLNVLHHVGRYFDAHISDMAQAKTAMAVHLQRLLAQGGCIWLQLGFNWQGDTRQPMFAKGTKREMTDFVEGLLGADARITTIGIYSPDSHAYEAVALNDREHPLWQRMEGLGEFGNRPLYLIESVR